MYKIRHIPTGMFYQPSRGSGNLSLKGKLYQNPPKIENTPLRGLRIVLRCTNPEQKLNKTQKKIADHFSLSFRNNWSCSIDQYVTTKDEDWEVVDQFGVKLGEVQEVTYDKVIETLPENITSLIGEDEIITQAFELLKKSPYVAFAYLLGIVHSTRELYDGEKEVIRMLQQYGVVELDEKWQKSMPDKQIKSEIEETIKELDEEKEK